VIDATTIYLARIKTITLKEPLCYAASLYPFQSPDITATVLAEFDSAWAMTMLPDGRMLVTEKGGTIWLLAKDGEKLGKITGAPDVTARGQGGLGDIILHPDFEGGLGDIILHPDFARTAQAKSIFLMLSATKKTMIIAARLLRLQNLASQNLVAS